MRTEPVQSTDTALQSISKQLAIQAVSLRFLQHIASQLEEGELAIAQVLKPLQIVHPAQLEQTYNNKLKGSAESLDRAYQFVREHEAAITNGDLETITDAQRAMKTVEESFQLPLTEELFNELLLGVKELGETLRRNAFSESDFKEQAIKHGVSERFIEVATNFFLSRDEPIALQFEATVSNPLDEALKLHTDTQATPLALQTGLDGFQQLIATRLEASRRELIDTTLRNPMLDMRPSRVKGVTIDGELTAEVFKTLVKDRQKMYFAAKLGGTAQNGTDEDQVTVPVPEQQQRVDTTDNVLQTTHTAANLQSRLVKTEREAISDLRDKGSQTLFLTLGTLHWKDKESNQERRSPLITIPIELKRANATSRYYVEALDDELAENLALCTKLKEDFGIVIPPMGAKEAFHVEHYLSEVAKAVSNHPDFEVKADEMSIGFFSFARYVMYQDLSPERWPAEDKLWDKVPIQDLLGRGVAVRPPVVPDGENVDDYAPAGGMSQVLDCDSSQTRAILEAGNSNIHVIQGPPGTGKSQTITNLIVSALGEGKKVLFVAEKMPALDAVHDSLVRLGLSEACLELHSHRTSKKEVLRDLEETLKLGKPERTVKEGIAPQLEALKKELNTYAKVMGTEVRNSGYTVQEVIGELAALGTSGAGRLSITPDQMKGWDKNHYQRALSEVRGLERGVREFGRAFDNPFYGSQLSTLVLTDKERVFSQIQEAVTTAAQVEEGYGALATKLGLKKDISFRQLRTIVTALAEVEEGGHLCYQADDANLTHENWRAKRSIKHLIESGKAFSEARRTLATVFKESAWSNDVSLNALEDAARAIETHGDQALPFLRFRNYREAIRVEKSIYAAHPPTKTEERVAKIRELIEAKKQGIMLDGPASSVAREMLGERNWVGRNSNFQEVETLYQWIDSFFERFSHGPHLGPVLKALSDPEHLRGLPRTCKQLLQEIEQLDALRSDVIDALGYPEDTGATFDEYSLRDSTDVFHRLHAQPAELEALVAYNSLAERVANVGLTALLPKADRWEHSGERLVESLQYAWFSALLKAAGEDHPELKNFERISHEEKIARFREFDEALFQHHAEELALSHWENLPRVNTGGQLGVLLREMEKSSRHMTVREMMQNAGNAIQAIKPVFMMSPQSVAKFLPPDALTEFDLVVFDEASQVRPADALGAIARGTQIVVVGDNKQLPPTRFFEGGKLNTESASSRTANVESVLDLATRQGAPNTRLNWHFRSKHPSLIAFSNAAYYDGTLQVFPSPEVDDGTKGLTFHKVEGGLYDRGKTRTNSVEAEQVAQAVLEHARTHPGQSLGVATFNTEQAELIYLKVEALRAAHRDLDVFMQRHNRDEPFFVKSLENIQGDERDSILISVGFAKDQNKPDSRMSMNFGPLNDVGGERRLNTLVTRAKHSCKVFCSFNPEEIDLKRTEARGVEDLQRYLHFARDRELNFRHIADRTPQETPLQQVMRTRLEERGYLVHTNVGSAGCYIDLAIVDPKSPERYVLGVMLDQNHYSSKPSSRDRERLVPQVLRGMGWNIHQEWGIEFLRNADSVLERIEQAISESDKPSSKKQPSRRVERARSEGLLVRGPTCPEYTFAAVPIHLEGPLYTVAPNEMANVIKEIVAIESPVHEDEVYRRIRKIGGDAQKSKSLNDRFGESVTLALEQGMVVQRGEFFYRSEKIERVPIRDRSNFPNTLKRIELIPPDEIDAAILQTVEHAYGIEEKELAEASLFILGFKSASEAAKSIFRIHARSLIKAGAIEKRGAYLYPKSAV
ncbi:MAG: DUF3320 domain-containing protein [Bdellovibrionales bacterium]|nr:DUF3320 domain-containing protein [Bdellovibrionales bacterium]